VRIAFLGDIVGRSGREAVIKELPMLRSKLCLDQVIVNAENASHGFGLSPIIAQDLFRAGVDVITLGNHSWDRKDLITYIAQDPRIVRPINYPMGLRDRVIISPLQRMKKKYWLSMQWVVYIWIRLMILLK